MACFNFVGNIPYSNDLFIIRLSGPFIKSFISFMSLIGKLYMSVAFVMSISLRNFSTSSGDIGEINILEEHDVFKYF